MYSGVVKKRGQVDKCVLFSYIKSASVGKKKKKKKSLPL